MRRRATQGRFDVPYHRHEARSNIVAQPFFRKTECRSAAIKGIGTGSVIKLKCHADRVDVVMPLAGRDGKTELCNRFAGAFDTVAQLPPAVAVMLAQLAQ